MELAWVSGVVGSDRLATVNIRTINLLYLFNRFMFYQSYKHIQLVIEIFFYFKCLSLF